MYTLDIKKTREFYAAQDQGIISKLKTPETTADECIRNGSVSYQSDQGSIEFNFLDVVTFDHYL